MLHYSNKQQTKPNKCGHQDQREASSKGRQKVSLFQDAILRGILETSSCWYSKTPVLIPAGFEWNKPGNYGEIYLRHSGKRARSLLDSTTRVSEIFPYFVLILASHFRFDLGPFEVRFCLLFSFFHAFVSREISLQIVVKFIRKIRVAELRIFSHHECVSEIL